MTDELISVAAMLFTVAAIWIAYLIGRAVGRREAAAPIVESDEYFDPQDGWGIG